MGNFFVSTGAGIGTGMLLIRIISIGPLLREYFLNQEYMEILRELGFGIGLHSIGSLLALLALFNYYKPLIISFADGVILTTRGSIISSEEIILYIEAYVSVPKSYVIYLHYLFLAMSLIGTAMLIAALIYGMGLIKIGKIISWAVIII